MASLLTVSAGLLPNGTAAALQPPTVDSGSLPSSGVGGGSIQDQECVEPGTDGSDLSGVPAALEALDIPDAWRYSTGKGQKVAVIDTGVNPSERLDVVAGGDYVGGGDGTQDCDGYGTAVAGVIAAKRSDSDGFSGVAPDSSIIAIRQSSPSFRADSDSAGWQEGYGSLHTLASAIVRAVELGATVISVSVDACLPANEDFGSGDAAVGAAVKHANDNNVVVVAAAGTVTHDCAQNPGMNGVDPSRPWDNVISKISPAWYSDHLLAVASVNEDGAVSAFSPAGPWVSVAAPGTGVVALDSSKGTERLVNGETVQGKFQPLQGTRFAAGYVAGVAALIRSRFPEMSAQDVIERIERTAHAPGTGRDRYQGYGVVDPVAALTAHKVPSGPARDIFASEKIAKPRPGPAIDLPTLITGLVLGLGAVAAVVITYVWVPSARRLRRSDDDSDL